MNKILCDDLWPTIKQLAAKARSKQAAVAYVTSEEYIKFKKGDVLITDASDNSISSGQTNAKLLADAFSRGAELYNLPGLHAKIYLLDRFVGSSPICVGSFSAENEGFDCKRGIKENEASGLRLTFALTDCKGTVSVPQHHSRRMV